MSSEARQKPFANSPPDDIAGDDLWKAYLEAVKGEDDASVKSWDGSTAGILTFTGLFAATVAAFIIESYKLLQPDTGAQTVALLAQLVAINNATPVVPPPELLPEPFNAPDTAVIVNSLWFLSLVISLVCALLATLIQEWTRDFLRDIQRRSPDITIKDYAFNHIFVRMGVEYFQLDSVTSIIVALMHVAVIIFLVGLAMFVSSIHHVPALVVETAGSIAALIYIIFSIMPFWDNSCPYRTPLTYGLTLVEIAALSIVLPLLYAFVFALVAVMEWYTNEKESLIREFNVFTAIKVVTRWEIIKWIPTRRLLGHRRTPADFPYVYSFKEEQARERELFVSDKRILVIWEHANGYLLDTKGSAAFFVYLPRQLLNTDDHNYDSFFVYLRRGSFMDRIAERMANIDSLDLDAGLGAVKLMKLLIGAKHGLEAKLSAAKDQRYHEISQAFSRHSVTKTLYAIAEAAYMRHDMTMFVALIEFRWMLIHRGIELTKDRAPFADDLSFIDDTLLALQNLGGCHLLPFHSGVPEALVNDIELARHRRDRTWGYQLAVRNAVTLLAQLICSQLPDQVDIGAESRPPQYSETNLWYLWEWREFEEPKPNDFAPPRASNVLIFLYHQATTTLGFSQAQTLLVRGHELLQPGIRDFRLPQSHEFIGAYSAPRDRDDTNTRIIVMLLNQLSKLVSIPRSNSPYYKEQMVQGERELKNLRFLDRRPVVEEAIELPPMIEITSPENDVHHSPISPGTQGTYLDAARTTQERDIMTDHDRDAHEDPSGEMHVAINDADGTLFSPRRTPQQTTGNFLKSSDTTGTPASQSAAEDPNSKTFDSVRDDDELSRTFGTSTDSERILQQGSMVVYQEAHTPKTSPQPALGQSATAATVLPVQSAHTPSPLSVPQPIANEGGSTSAQKENGLG